MAEAAKSLKEMWVLGTRQMVSERRGKTARFLAQLKDQSSDYAKAHHAVIAECDKMLSANEMLETLKSLFEHCAMVHMHWGENSNQKEADAAIAAGRAAIAKAKGE